MARNTLGATSIHEVNARLTALVNERNELKKNVEALNNKIASLQSGKIVDEIKVIDGIAKLAVFLPGSSRDNVTSILDSLKGKYPDHLFVLIGEVNLPIVVSVQGKAKEKYHAGNLVREIATKMGGSGGGRPDVAFGAGKDASKVKDALGVING